MPGKKRSFKPKAKIGSATKTTRGKKHSGDLLMAARASEDTSDRHPAQKVVFIGTCSNCEHMPLRLNKLLALLSLLIAILSGIVLNQSGLLKFHHLLFVQDDVFSPPSVVHAP